MRVLLIMSLFLASYADAAWGDYEERRELSVAAGGANAVDIDAGAGRLVVTGGSGDTVTVVAVIHVPDAGEDKARRIIEKSLELSLENEGGRVRLQAGFDGGGGWFRDSPRIDLEVRMPRGLALRVDDSSGSVEVRGVDGDIDIEDGSGSLELERLGGSVRIDDGSGSIDAREIGGNLDIVDGSGSITVRGVGGTVTIDDGSGSIRVSDVARDLIILDDGSGSLRVSDVRGTVDDRS